VIIDVVVDVVVSGDGDGDVLDPAGTAG